MQSDPDFFGNLVAGGLGTGDRSRALFWFGRFNFGLGGHLSGREEGEKAVGRLWIGNSEEVAQWTPSGLGTDIGILGCR